MGSDGPAGSSLFLRIPAGREFGLPIAMPGRGGPDITTPIAPVEIDPGSVCRWSSGAKRRGPLAAELRGESMAHSQEGSIDVVGRILQRTSLTTAVAGCIFRPYFRYSDLKSSRPWRPTTPLRERRGGCAIAYRSAIMGYYLPDVSYNSRRIRVWGWPSMTANRHISADR